MILGTGIDAAAISRYKNLSDGLLRRIYSTDELAEYKALEGAAESVRASFLASRFAVKEAYAKARGTGFSDEVIPTEITTCKDKLGKPYIKLSGTTLTSAPSCRIHLSLTHEEPLALAMVILEGEESGKD